VSGKEGIHFPRPTKPNARSNAKLACDRLSISPVGFGEAPALWRELPWFCFFGSRRNLFIGTASTAASARSSLFGFQFMLGGFPGLIERHKQLEIFYILLRLPDGVVCSETIHRPPCAALKAAGQFH